MQIEGKFCVMKLRLNSSFEELISVGGGKDEINEAEVIVKFKITEPSMRPFEYQQS